MGGIDLRSTCLEPDTGRIRSCSKPHTELLGTHLPGFNNALYATCVTAEAFGLSNIGGATQSCLVLANTCTDYNLKYRPYNRFTFT